MKKIIASILAVGILASCIASAGAANINMCVKDNYVTRDLQTLGPIDMIPILDIAGELGLKTYFDGYTLWIEKDYKAYKFTLNSANVYDGQGNWYGLDVTMRYINKKLYIPSTFLTNVLGISYSWYSGTNTLYIDADSTLNWVKTNQEYEDAANCRDAYANYIRNNKYSWDGDAKFELGYLNNDDVPELFVTTSSFSSVNVFTYRQGKMIEIGSFGWNGYMQYKEREGLIYDSYHTLSNGIQYEAWIQEITDDYQVRKVCSCGFEDSMYGRYYYVNGKKVSYSTYDTHSKEYGFDLIEYECNSVPNLYITEYNITNGIYNF